MRLSEPLTITSFQYSCYFMLLLRERAQDRKNDQEFMTLTKITHWQVIFSELTQYTPHGQGSKQRLQNAHK